MTKVQSWEVEVRVNGDSVLTIGGEGAAHIAGIENIDDYAGTVETCAHHLLAFIGQPLGLAVQQPDWNFIPKPGQLSGPSTKD